MPLRRPLLVFLALGLTASAFAQTMTTGAPLVLPPLVVTGTVAPTPLSRTAANVTVISREQIAAQRAASVTDLLRHVAGLHIDQAAGRGSVSSVYLRGGEPNFVVVLIDGVKVNDPTNSRGGSFDFSTLNTDQIERIEIVRGPLSAVYGSDAMSGAIHIITQRGEAQPVWNAEVAGGRFGYVRTLFQTSGLLGTMDYALSGSYLDNGEPAVGSDYVNHTVHANFGFPLSPEMELRGVWRYADSRSSAFPDASGGPTFAVLRQVEERETQELTLGFTFTHQPFAWWEYHVQVGIYHRREAIDSPGVALNMGDFRPVSVSDNVFQRDDLMLQHTFSVTQGVHLALGAQVQFEDGKSMGTQESTAVGLGVSAIDVALSRQTWSPFFEVQLALLPALLLQGGVRVDVPEGFGTEVSPRFGASYTVSATRTTLRLNWGEGFKLPSFFALGSAPPVGNPNLRPETSHSVDAGVTQSLWGERVTLGVTYFYHDFTDLIDFDFATFQLLNRTRVTTAGVEMSMRVQPCQDLGVTGHLTYVKTAINGNDAALRNRPEWRGGFAVHWRPLDGLNANLQTLVVGETLDVSIPTGERTLEAYVRVDLTLTWTVFSTWQVFVAVDNLLDADYEEFIGFPAPGIRPRGGVRARF